MALHLIRYQLASSSQKWSFKGVIENVKRRTRLILESLYKERGNKKKSEWLSSYGTHNTTGCLKTSERQFYNFLQRGFFQRAARWSRDSLASVFTRSGHRVFRGTSGAAVSFVGFVLSTKPSLLTEQEELEGLSYEIRDAFSKIAPDAVYPSYKNCPKSVLFNDLEIGSLLAKGCNAVVYSACWKEPKSEKERCEQTEKKIMPHSEVAVSNLEEGIDIETVQFQNRNLFPFDLAVKVMFNYSAQSDAMTIWRAMFKEALPALHGLPLNNIMGIKNRIPPHPNIVQMYCAFADEMPLLPHALSHYPQALPYRLTKHGYGRNMTLFLIMKRYHCSLENYLKMNQPSTHTSLLLFCQLLEGLVHLQQHGFVHRDLKTDNILLDLSRGVWKPLLVISDFGCCLEGLKLPYTTEEIDRGGNISLMAPEIATAEVGPFSVIDYSRSDLWTLGTLAYEIFGGRNPFYLSDDVFLEATTYSENELPPLPMSVPKIIRKLIKDILCKDPRKRPSPAFAATVCQLLLHAPPDLYTLPMDKKKFKKIVRWMFQLSAETFLQATVQPCNNQSLEFQLRYTFCRRIQFLELFQAVQYMSQI